VPSDPAPRSLKNWRRDERLARDRAVRLVRSMAYEVMPAVIILYASRVTFSTSNAGSTW
jgi:hypothetical protein